ncbi:hypothetical protein [Pontibacillus chungwhensis]|uniref:Uncharacterized protein n=1 Tax=Pontibacillus chungwhensis TaxID=265426 RepID=A0ABY8V3A7_9BACI|nr:hypothetical protein [Pontibacillus chungwhensis]WIF99314.1 hypothetical protein QNI29_06550 [Pontibacillus chungwhensis]
MIVIFVLWVSLQLFLDMTIFKNPFNYFVAFIIFFFGIKFVLSNRSD